MYRIPDGISYTDMCIYIDTHIYAEYDSSTVYEYLYHITKMLANRNGYFDSSWDYENFALYAASALFMRLTEKVNLPKIRSILNYTKKVLYPLKVDFMKLEYAQTLSKDKYEDELNYNFDNIISKSLSSLDISDFGMTMADIGTTCKRFLRTIPYDENSSEWMNIYISVMLTFLNSITLPNKKASKLRRLEDNKYLRDYHIDNFYEDEREAQPILFHLPSHMSNYISVLSRQLRSIVAKDLSDILHTKVHSDFQLVQYEKDNFMEESVFTDDD
jgi:hypothetical protein